MIKNLEEACTLPLAFDSERCELLINPPLNYPSYRVRKLHDLRAVWAQDIKEKDQIVYRYTSGLYLPGQQEVWEKANIIYGIVIFKAGVFSQEYVKSSGQYHPALSPTGLATPEIYTVLSGTGLFLLQKSSPPYKEISDVVLVEVKAGESFIVPPDYGHLQINPTAEALVFSYLVMDGLEGVYQPYKDHQGAMYYVMEGKPRFRFNHNYPKKLPLRELRASQLDQHELLRGGFTYRKAFENLNELSFITQPELFPPTAALQIKNADKTHNVEVL